MSTLIDPLWDTLVVLDEHGVIVSVNKVWRDFAESNGGSAALAAGVGMDYLAVVRRSAVTDVLAAAVLQGLEEVLAGRQSMFMLEYPCHSPDHERWFELYATPLRGSAAGVIVGHRDITPRKHALAQTASERWYGERNLRAVLNGVSSMIGYWDRHLRNRFANHAYRDWFGVDPATIPGKHIREVIGEERYRLNLPYIQAALRGSAQQFERAIPSPDGRSVRHALARYIPDVVNGEVDGFFVEVTDVTSIKASELALQVAQEVGRLGSYITEEELWACTTCNACTQACPVNIDPVGIIMDLRRYLVMEESKVPPALATMLTNVENNGAPWQMAQADRLKWADS